MQAFIGLGANLGEADATLSAALDALAALPRSRLVASSSVYRSAPVDARGPDFLNMVAQVETSLAPAELLAALQAIERHHGRERPYRHAPRILDLDLLLCGDERIESADLTLPHPRMTERAFVLLPLAEIAPAQVVPGRGAVAGLLAAVSGQRIYKLAR